MKGTAQGIPFSLLTEPGGGACGDQRQLQMPPERHGQVCTRVSAA